MRAQVPALLHQALGLQKAGNLAGAQAVYEHILRLQPRRADVLHMLAVVAGQRNDFARAAQLLGEVIAVEPVNAAAHSDRGVALKGIGQLEAALASLDRAIGLAPDYAAAYSNRGNVLLALEQPASALASFEQAIALKPDYAEAHYNRGIALQALQQRAAALESYDRAIALRPQYVEAHLNRGFALMQLNEFQEALASCERAIALKPDCAEAHLYRGNVLRQLKQPAAALASYAEAIRVNPGHPAAHLNRAVVLYDLRQYEAAIASLRRASALKHTATDWYGLYLFLHAAICDWHPLDADLGELRAAIERGEPAINPVLFVALSDSEALQSQAARRWAQRVPGAGLLPEIPRHARHDRIRVGYFSPDFHSHPVAQCVAELIERHDRSRFEITAFAFGVDNGDEMRKRLEKAFDRFIDVHLQSDLEVARLARGLEIDLAVDLAGFTDGCRPAIFAMRAAPLQISYVGYPATTGADCMDYLIADPLVIPPGSEGHYHEKIIYLPDCYLPCDSRRSIAALPSREALGLPREGFVFCCFNNSYKINARMFDIWMRLLLQVPRSVLWLAQSNTAAVRNLQREAGARGVSPERLIFAARLPSQSDHLARLAAADLFLDTLPYNAHATASDALWVGLPLLSCAGASFAGRVASSLLTAIGLPELIAPDLAAYETLALQLARDSARLGRIRRKLAEHRSTAPLFATARLARHLELAYREIYDRCHLGVPPQHLRVAAIGGAAAEVIRA